MYIYPGDPEYDGIYTMPNYDSKDWNDTAYLTMSFIHVDGNDTENVFVRNKEIQVSRNVRTTINVTIPSDADNEITPALNIVIEETDMTDGESVDVG